MTAARPLRSVQPVVSDEPLISMAEVAARIGIPLQSLRRMRTHGRGPRGYRVGKHVQFRWSEVDAWLQGQREPIK